MTTRRFEFTGAMQAWTVPTGVTFVKVKLYGAGGGSGGGAGGYMAGTLSVSPGSTLYFVPGGAGKGGVAATGGAGGYNGGGAGGPATSTSNGAGGGGGASDIRVGGTALGNRVAVAAGGGGLGFGGGTGGAGGAATGATGGGTYGGNGGGPAAGGAVSGAANGTGGFAGGLGAGGAGAGNSGSATPHHGAGGGGSGYYGGAGGRITSGTGAANGGGGGGSNYAGSMTAVTSTRGAGAAGGVNGSIELTYNQPPTAPTLSSPSSGFHVDYSQPLTFTWAFQDPDPTDSQASADLRYKDTTVSTWTTVTNAATTAGQYVLPAVSLTSGVVYEWQVRTADSAGLMGPWSSSNFFTATTPPGTAPTFTAPPAGADLASNPRGFIWTTPTTQASFQLRMLPDNAGVADTTQPPAYDSGEVISTIHARAATWASSIANGTFWHIQVRYSEFASTGLWSPWADNGVQKVNISPPVAPTVTATVSQGLASVTLTITNSATAPAAVVNNIYRTDLTNGGAEVLVEPNLPASTPWTDPSPASKTAYSYRVEAVTVDGATNSTSAAPAQVVLNRVYLYQVDAPMVLLIAGSASGKVLSDDQAGEYRVYGGTSAGVSRTRLVTTPSTARGLPVTLMWLTPAQIALLLSWRGQTVLVRDVNGLRLFCGFLSVPRATIANLSDQRANVQLDLREVTYDESQG